MQTVHNQLFPTKFYKFQNIRNVTFLNTWLSKNFKMFRLFNLSNKRRNLGKDKDRAVAPLKSADTS